MKINTHGLKMRGLYDVTLITDMRICYDDCNAILYDLYTGMVWVEVYNYDDAEEFPYTMDGSPYYACEENLNIILVAMCCGRLLEQETADLVFEAVQKLRQRELTGQVTEYIPINILTFSF